MFDLSVVFLSSAFFFWLNRKLLSKLTGRVAKEELLVNTLVSLVHSVVVSVMASLSLYSKTGALSDIINSKSWAMKTTLCVSTGYFSYDLYDYMKISKGSFAEIAIHHVVVLTAFCVALFSNKYLPFAMLSLLIEYNSIFLHLFRMFKIVNPNEPLLFQVVLLGNYITAGMFRVPIPAYMVYCLFGIREQIPISHFCLALLGTITILVVGVLVVLRLWRRIMAQKSTKNAVGHHEMLF